jgi:hypothetical protein
MCEREEVSLKTLQFFLGKNTHDTLIHIQKNMNAGSFIHNGFTFTIAGASNNTRKKPVKKKKKLKKIGRNKTYILENEIEDEDIPKSRTFSTVYTLNGEKYNCLELSLRLGIGLATLFNRTKLLKSFEYLGNKVTINRFDRPKQRYTVLRGRKKIKECVSSEIASGTIGVTQAYFQCKMKDKKSEIFKKFCVRYVGVC